VHQRGTQGRLAHLLTWKSFFTWVNEHVNVQKQRTCRFLDLLYQNSFHICHHFFGHGKKSFHHCGSSLTYPDHCPIICRSTVAISLGEMIFQNRCCFIPPFSDKHEYWIILILLLIKSYKSHIFFFRHTHTFWISKVQNMKQYIYIYSIYLDQPQVPKKRTELGIHIFQSENRSSARSKKNNPE